MIWWILGAVVIGFFLFGTSKNKRTPSRTRSVPRDGSEMYWALHKRADEIKRGLEDMVWKHGDDESYWDRILQKYEAWLAQEEEVVKVPCIENDGTASYTESETLFYILGRRGRHEDAQRYVQRLSRVKHHDPEGKWQAALAQIQREDQAEAEHQAWLATVPDQVQSLAADGRSAQLHKLATLCVSREEPDAAQSALDALQALDGTQEDHIRILRAGISRLRNRYADAIRHLQSAYPIAVASGTKSRINKVEVEMRKVLKERGAADPATEASRLLAESKRTEQSPPAYPEGRADAPSGSAEA